jgi:hypothetical protein
MKPFFYAFSGALVVLALSLGTPDAWAQSRQHGGGGGGTRTNSGGGGGGTAVSRGSGGSSGGGGHVTSSGGTRTAGPSSTGSATAGSGTASPRGSRPNNGGSPVIGEATARTGRYYDGGRGYRYSPYDPYYLYGYGAFGLGAFYYDPFWWGYPYGYGGYGYGGYGYGGYGYPYSYGDSGYYARQDEGVKGGLKLKVEPKNAEVYVDGYYLGLVDDYNGAFQRLNLVAGTHHIEIRAKGYETLAFDVKIEPRETISYHGDLQPQATR